MKLSILTTALLACSLSLAPMTGFANCVKKTSNKHASAAYKSKAKAKKVARRPARASSAGLAAAGSSMGSSAAGGQSSSSTLVATDNNVTGANSGCVSQNRGGGLGDTDVCPNTTASNTTETPSTAAVAAAPLATPSDTQSTASTSSSSNSSQSMASSDASQSSGSSAGSSAAGGQSSFADEPVTLRAYGSQPTGANSGCVSPNRGGALGDPDICPFATTNDTNPQ